MKHKIKVNTGTFRIEWPFYRMDVGDYIIVSGSKVKEVKQRAMSAAYHYRESYGKWFKAEKISDTEYKIIRWR